MYLDIAALYDTTALVKKGDKGDLLGHTGNVSISVPTAQLISVGYVVYFLLSKTNFVAKCDFELMWEQHYQPFFLHFKCSL